MGEALILLKFVCPSGHTWDAWGKHSPEGEFVPDDLRTYLCPTCDQVKVAQRDPEQLA